MLLVSTAAKVHVSGDGKLLAVIVGLAVLGVVWLVYQLSTGSWTVWKLADGQDGVLSTSKLQWFVWLAVIAFSYTVLWVARASSGHYVAISDIPANVLAVLGISTGSAVLAKGITVAQISNGQAAKPKAAVGDPPAAGGALSDDDGVFDLGKVQMVAFTVIAVVIYLATLIHRLRTDPVNTALPNIDSSLLVLMGISHGGYLGKKLVTTGTPRLLPRSRPVKPGTPVTLHGAALGGGGGGSELLMDGEPVDDAKWTAKSVEFKLEADAGLEDGQELKMQAIVNGQDSNTITLRVSAVG